ncbi:biosynthetic-type acetolactate synthase large subunit [uncultured Clostridium sp.]|uniref:biosynthetic-type acetolactate synthase large subunit n=1 Tax=uncultured Clostridium sp. TaxID=59620 RepID=UPI0026104FC9|nr:biosynthetic-type acetolactate synthase large subunit [uncultured Clostridium sp.]
MMLNGSEILVKCLLDQGVDTIFGYPGGAVLNIYDALYKNRDKINHVLTCHEQGAAHAADGYARSTGRVGVCLATSGPGATNLVTGIATAYMDSIPMVAITGNVHKSLLGKDSFQEVDIAGITMPITKHNYIVKHLKDLQKVIREAFYIAQQGRPGPVLIDITKDVTADIIEYKYKAPKNIKRSTDYITDSAIGKVAEILNSSKKPFIYAGGGIISSEAEKELKRLAKKISAPVSSSLMGLSAFDSEDKLATGMIGMHGTKASNLLAVECDAFICIGARFSDRVIGKKEDIKNASVIHIDVDPAEINKNIKADCYVVGDIKEVLNKLLPLLDEKSNKDWSNRLEELKEVESTVIKPNTPQELFSILNDITKGDAVIVTDVGQHQMWTALGYKFKTPRTFISSGGLGTMGFGLGAAIGAQFANPDKKVILITGDGSFAMNCNEVPTAIKSGLPLTIILLNNNALGMVRQWQTLFYDKRYSSTTLDRKTDFVKLVESFGGQGYRVDIEDNSYEILKEAIESRETTLVDYIIHEDNKVFPMVAPGSPIKDIILGEE